MRIKTATDQTLYLSKKQNIWKSYTKKKCKLRHHQTRFNKVAQIFALINKLVHSLWEHYKLRCFWKKIKPRARILHNRLRRISTLGRIVGASQHCGCPSALPLWVLLSIVGAPQHCGCPSALWMLLSIVAAPQHCGCPSADVWAQLMSPQRRHLRLFSSI